MCSSLTSETFYRPEPVYCFKNQIQHGLFKSCSRHYTFDHVFDKFMKSNCLIELMKQLLRNSNEESVLQEQQQQQQQQQLAFFSKQFVQ